MLAWSAILVSALVIGGIFHTYSGVRSRSATNGIGLKIHAHHVQKF
jgi:hypothetical protein